MRMRRLLMSLVTLTLAVCGGGGCTSSTSSSFSVNNADGSSTETKTESVTRNGKTVERRTTTTVSKDGTKATVTEDKQGENWVRVKPESAAGK